MRMLERVNSLPLLVRWSCKFSLLIVATMLVLFPRLDRLLVTLSRWNQVESLIEPDSPALQPWVAEFDQNEKDDSWTRSRLMHEVEQYVYRKLPYAWDWELWGNADYLPTVEEAIHQGREDCDGRAVVAASMLRRYGFESRLVSDFKHVWVVTDIGETMSPGSTKAIDFTAEGARFDWSILWEVPRLTAFGISVFPLWRELILVVVTWLLMIGRNMQVRSSLFWLPVWFLGLMLVREGGRYGEVVDAKYIAGGILWLAAMIGMYLQARRSRQLQV